LLPAASSKPHAMNRRQVAAQALPAIALIVGYPERSGRRAERQTVAGVIDRQAMAIGQIVRMFLRQTLGQRLEMLAAVARAGDDDMAADRHARFVLLRGNEPCRLWIARVHGYREAKNRRLHVRDLAPRFGAVGCAKD